MTNLVLTFIGVLIAVLTFYFQFNKEPKKKISNLKEMVLVQFKINQQLSIDLKNSLKSFTSKTGCHNEIFIPGFSFSQYIELLDDSQKTNLSNKLYQEIKKNNIDNEHYYHSALESLKTQYESLNILYNAVKIKFDNIS
ncbi:hypothetical protein ABMY20_15190 [Tenacibaculum sp. SSH1-16]|uniref:hypothetical protein n=1 Tax=Tenacibaculum sp. SSH1-16 TaxID=3136667 RepID=UPI0032C40A99|nr:hypothetical protein BACY1_20630 [Tenacibaculum mesophilum]